MPVPANIAALSTTAGPNSPQGSEAVTTVDDYLRAHAAFIAQLRDGKLDVSAVSAYILTLLNDADAATARATLGAVGSSEVVNLTANQNIGGIKTFDTGILSNSSVRPIGYTTDVRDTVTQTTSKSTAVTINNPVGEIILHNQMINPGNVFFFDVNNSLVTLSDVIILSGGSFSFFFDVFNVFSGGFQIRGFNYTGSAVTNSPRLNFAIIRGQT
jgi:hypothetical protein